MLVQYFSMESPALKNEVMPRGMAAGVLAILPFQKGVSNTDFFPVVVFSCVVTTLLLFAVGFPVYKNRLAGLLRAPDLSTPVAIGEVGVSDATSLGPPEASGSAES